MHASSVNFEPLPKVNNHPLGELGEKVTLIRLHMFEIAESGKVWRQKKITYVVYVDYITLSVPAEYDAVNKLKLQVHAQFKTFLIYSHGPSPGVDVMITIFCDFRQFSAKKMAFFSKTNVMMKFLHNLALFRVKNANFFAEFFSKNISKIITSVPG
jgi:hypothetical protein